jgi:hypothetical protein
MHDEVGADDAIARVRRAVREVERETHGRPLTGTSHDDADAVVGTIATDSAIGFDPLPVLAALSHHGAQVVVMGQVAGIMHGSTELTGDLDLLWDGDIRQAPRLAAAFGSLGSTITDAEGVAIPCAADAFQLPKVYFDAPTASGDCCTTRLPWGELDIGRIIRHADTAASAEGVIVYYVNADDLIKMRRAVGRPKDLRRADELDRLLNAPKP